MSDQTQVADLVILKIKVGPKQYKMHILKDGQFSHIEGRLLGHVVTERNSQIIEDAITKVADLLDLRLELAQR